MSTSVAVRAIDALEDQRAAWFRFGDECRQALHAVGMQLQKTEAFLDGHQRHWQAEVDRCEEEARRAVRALLACEASGGRDRDGRYVPPVCRRQEAALEDAKRALRRASEALGVVVAARNALKAKAQEYERHARSMTGLLDGEVPRAAAFLQARVDALHAYVAVPSGGISFAALGLSGEGAGEAIASDKFVVATDAPSAKAGTPDAQGTPPESRT